MPRTNRTPPSGGVMRSNSKSDATGNPTPQSPDNIAQRSKRPRAECSPASDLSQFREEIKNMLAEWKSDQDNVLTKLVSELSDLKAQNVKIQKSYLEIEKSIEFMSSKYEEFFKQIIEFEKERKELKDYILNLETKIQDLQNKSRPSVLEIRNVPKKDDETLQDLINVVCKVGKTVKMDISPTELRDIYRAPGKPDTNSAIIADFTSVITKSQYLSNVRQYNKERAPSEKLTSGQVGLPDSLVILKSDYSDIETQILNLRDDCAVGWDKISARIIKASRATLVPPIAYICNLAVDSGVFPDAFKKAIVHPIHKAGDRGSIDNYRPISVLPALSKILERILNNTLVNYMNKNSIISDKQFGFRSGRSTEDAVIALTSSIVQHIDKKRKCLAVFLDLSKAFDSVSIPLLVEKIEQAGVRGVDIYCDYLNGRKQVSQIESLTSDEEGISYGVPQGSILGPTLFQLYINQLCNLQLSNSEIFTYADDTAIVIHGTDWSELKESAEISLRRLNISLP
ncbi:unnamed protein product [Plutella xylostella]|uniref:(diamondback moth) hypothetical protein n=1 Tax=Plutella xylostella TaxID=51655 RepID=A0A8S4DEY1_PLUXY|nr:unnamed protein product [Plutella xylostella]